MVAADGVVIDPNDPQQVAVYHGAQATGKIGVPAGAKVMLLGGAAANAVYPLKAGGKNGGAVVVQGGDPGFYLKPAIPKRNKDLAKRQQMAFVKYNNRQPTDEDLRATFTAVDNLYF